MITRELTLEEEKVLDYMRDNKDDRQFLVTVKLDRDQWTKSEKSRKGVLLAERSSHAEECEGLKQMIDHSWGNADCPGLVTIDVEPI